ncbi:hypothetical protein F6455_03240 [Proteobacteria bacterium 005FR1]|nr:hypothetical protein [Proteobacteria bacterium 005FR1]
MTPAVETFYSMLAVVALAIILTSASAGYFRYRLHLSEPIIALLIGTAIGPFVTDAISLDIAPGSTATLMLTELARITLAVAIVGAALRLPHGCVRKHALELLIVLTIGMAGMWLISSALAYWVFDYALLGALLLGAVLAPTDPVLASPIVTGRLARERVPRRVGDLIVLESGSNDGAALALVLLPVELLRHTQPSAAFSEWLLTGILWEIGVAILIGLVIGALAGRLHSWSREKHWADEESMLPLALATGLATLAIARVMDTDGLLAVFFASVSMSSHFPAGDATRQFEFRQAVGRFADFTFFISLGIVLPLNEWLQQIETLLPFAIAILLVRRLPLWLALSPLLPSLKKRNEAAFAGWFGPIGAATIFYALSYSGMQGAPDLWPVASFLVATSVVIHGVSSTYLTRRMFSAADGGGQC